MKVRVYFTDSDRQFWLKWFLYPGFSHCFIVLDDTILINPSSHYTYVGLSEGEYEGLWIDVDVEEPERKAKTIWEVNTCVTQIKNFLGIRKYGIFTPYALYRYLIHGKSVQKAQSTQSSTSNTTGTSLESSSRRCIEP